MSFSLEQIVSCIVEFLAESEWYQIILYIIGGLFSLLLVLVFASQVEQVAAIVYSLNIMLLLEGLYEVFIKVNQGERIGVWIIIALILLVLLAIFMSIIICACDEVHTEKGLWLCICYFFKGLVYIGLTVVAFLPLLFLGGYKIWERD